MSTGGRTFTKICFANGIDGLATIDEELAGLVEHLQGDKTSETADMGRNVNKTNLIINNIECILTGISVNRQSLEAATYLDRQSLTLIYSATSV